MPEQVFRISTDTVYDFHLYVLYRCRSADDEAGVCAENPHEKAMQRALIQYRNPKNYDLVMEALRNRRPYGSGRI